VVLRFNPATLRTSDAERQRLFLQEKEAEVTKKGVVKFAILIPFPQTQPKAIKLGPFSKPSPGFQRVRCTACAGRLNCSSSGLSAAAAGHLTVPTKTYG
jgi:hypothetical protein